MFFQLDDNNQPQVIYPMAFPTNLPNVVPMPVVPQPQQLRPELEILPNQVLNANNTAPLYYNGSTWANGKYVALPKCFEIFNSDGERVPPIGYTFVSMVVPDYELPTPSQENGVSCPPSPQLASHHSNNSTASSSPLPLRSTQSNSRRGSLCPPSPNQGPVTYSREPSVEPTAFEEKEKPQKNRKFRHRSKQERIQEVHEKLRIKYTAMGLYAGNDEVLRGFDTVRVHVKTYHALSKIQEPLDDIENHPRIQIYKIATPFSMKNRFQKKGFIVYLKLTDPKMVPIVQDIFSRYKEHFNKCDLALKKEDKIAMQKEEEARLAAEAAVVLPEPCSWMEDDDTFECKTTLFWERPGMAKRSSLQGA